MRIKLDEGANVSRAHEDDAGLDLHARETRYVRANGSAIFDTGVHVELPKGSAGILISKSGLNVNHDIESTGLIDAGYTGSIKVRLANHSDEDYLVREGDKISQLVIVPVFIPTLEFVEKLEDTKRGAGGFGSSGR